MRPVRNVFQKLSRTEQRREGVVAYLWCLVTSSSLEYPTFCPLGVKWNIPNGSGPQLPRPQPLRQQRSRPALQLLSYITGKRTDQLTQAESEPLFPFS